MSSELSSLPFVRSLWLYTLLPPSSWSSICQLRRSPLECLSHPALPSTCCELRWTAWHCSGVIPSLMRPDCQLWAFNAEVTGFPTIAFSPCSHSCPPTLVPLFGDDGEGCGGRHTALSSQDTSSPRTWCSSVISSSRFGPSLVILGFFLLGWALGLIIWNGPGHPSPLAPQQPFYFIFYFSISHFYLMNSWNIRKKKKRVFPSKVLLIKRVPILSGWGVKPHQSHCTTSANCKLKNKTYHT